MPIVTLLVKMYENVQEDSKNLIRLRDVQDSSKSKFKYHFLILCLRFQTVLCKFYSNCGQCTFKCKNDTCGTFAEEESALCCYKRI